MYETPEMEEVKLTAELPLMLSDKEEIPYGDDEFQGLFVLNIQYFAQREGGSTFAFRPSFFSPFTFQ